MRPNNPAALILCSGVTGLHLGVVHRQGHSLGKGRLPGKPNSRESTHPLHQSDLGLSVTALDPPAKAESRGEAEGHTFVKAGCLESQAVRKLSARP